MSKRYRRLLENQARVEVVAQAHDSMSAVWFVTLAAVFAGVFYFWGYYVWEMLWRVLSGG